MPFHSQPAAAPILAPPRRGWRCDLCDTPTRLSDLNDDLVCEACAGPFVDEDSVIDCSDVAMLRAYGTWG